MLHRFQRADFVGYWNSQSLPIYFHRQRDCRQGKNKGISHLQGNRVRHRHPNGNVSTGQVVLSLQDELVCISSKQFFLPVHQFCDLQFTPYSPLLAASKNEDGSSI